MLSNNYLSNFAKLASAPVIAQAFSFFLIPVISRLYSQSTFGEFNFIVAQVGIFAVFSTMSFDQAIVISKNKIHEKLLFWMTIFISFIVSAISLLLFIQFNGYVEKNITVIIYLFFSIYLHGVHMALQGLSFRLGSFNLIASSRVLSSIGSKVSSILYSIYVNSTVLGLLIGNLFSSLFSILILGYKRPAVLISYSEFITNFKLVIREYIQFPIFAVLVDLLYRLRQLIILYYLGKYFGNDNVGSYSMALIILGIPLTLVSAPLNEVFYKGISDLKLQDDILTFFYKVTNYFVRVIAGMYFAIGLLFPFFSTLILGKEWSGIDPFIRLCSLAFIADSLYPFVASLLRILNRQVYTLAYQLLLGAFSILAIFTGSFYGNVNYSLVFLVIGSFMSICFLLVATFSLDIKFELAKFINFRVISFLLFFLVYFVLSSLFMTEKSTWCGILISIFFIFIYFYVSFPYFLRFFKSTRIS